MESIKKKSNSRVTEVSKTNSVPIFNPSFEGFFVKITLLKAFSWEGRKQKRVMITTFQFLGQKIREELYTERVALLQHQQR